MASPSVTYTFVNSTTADAAQVNQNFADLIAGMTDGSKDFNINAITAAGAATFNGAVTLGNASGDAITATGTFGAINATGNISFDGGTFVFNESGADKDFRVESDGNANMIFVDASTNRVGIGTASPSAVLDIYAATGGVNCRVNGAALADTDSANCIVYASKSGGSLRYAGVGVYKHSGIAEAVAWLDMSQQNGTEKFLWADDSSVWRISSTASHAGTTSGTAVGDQTSDERTKSDIKPISYGLDTVLKLNPIEFIQFGENKLGFSAQQTLRVVPQAVVDTKEDIDGTENTKLGMQYVQIIPILVKAIQEQQQQIEQIKALIK
jgi:hypothetical protein